MVSRTTNPAGHESILVPSEGYSTRILKIQPETPPQSAPLQILAGFKPSWRILNFTDFQVTCLNGGRGCEVQGGLNPMHPPEEFLKHAAECKLTAKLARDPASKAAWSQMAERWLQCAELAQRKSLTARYATPVGRSRRPSPAWRHL